MAVNFLKSDKFKIVALFIISRIILEFFGVFAKIGFLESHSIPFNGSWKVLLDIWAVWDSGWYLEIAKNGYTLIPVSPAGLLTRVCCGQNTFGFFPLYPLLIKFGYLFIGNYQLSGVLLSNLFLVFSLFIIYHLFKNGHNDKTALKTVFYFLLFPTSFVLSGIFSESTFLFLSLLGFYFIKKNKILFAGFAGFLLSLTRPTGVLILAPYILYYLMLKNYKHKMIKPDILFFILIPLGLVSFMLYNYYISGDLFYYFHLKEAAWGAQFSNPIKTLLILLTSNSATKFIALFTLIEILILIKYIKSISFYLFIYSLIVILTPLLQGAQIAIGIPRMSSVIFPIGLIFARNIKGQTFEIVLICLLLVFQLLLMTLWVNGILII